MQVDSSCRHSEQAEVKKNNNVLMNGFAFVVLVQFCLLQLVALLSAEKATEYNSMYTTLENLLRSPTLGLM